MSVFSVIQSHPIDEPNCTVIHPLKTKDTISIAAMIHKAFPNQDMYLFALASECQSDSICLVGPHTGISYVTN